ncbi:hypothetical protein P4O66_016353 [Electrophorus voltai]|uniref:CWF21 domain-containing protein n=1 Tax=Electrophorus voltai TaxID=2609070 RepID=A0AAD8YVJ0_9TELE|nr:hypothetical protein P4O66_016353 [Electrophorus voltai]
MYDEAGLPSPEGGANGPKAGGESEGPVLVKVARRELLHHERKRRVELKCMELQEMMEEQGLMTARGGKDHLPKGSCTPAPERGRARARNVPTRQSVGGAGGLLEQEIMRGNGQSSLWGGTSASWVFLLLPALFGNEAPSAGARFRQKTVVCNLRQVNERRSERVLMHQAPQAGALCGAMGLHCAPLSVYCSYYTIENVRKKEERRGEERRGEEKRGEESGGERRGEGRGDERGGEGREGRKGERRGGGGGVGRRGEGRGEGSRGEGRAKERGEGGRGGEERREERRGEERREERGGEERGEERRGEERKGEEERIGEGRRGAKRGEEPRLRGEPILLWLTPDTTTEPKYGAVATFKLKMALILSANGSHKKASRAHLPEHKPALAAAAEPHGRRSFLFTPITNQQKANACPFLAVPLSTASLTYRLQGNRVRVSVQEKEETQVSSRVSQQETPAQRKLQLTQCLRLLCRQCVQIAQQGLHKSSPKQRGHADWGRLSNLKHRADGYKPSGRSSHSPSLSPGSDHAAHRQNGRHGDRVRNGKDSRPSHLEGEKVNNDRGSLTPHLSLARHLPEMNAGVAERLKELVLPNIDFGHEDLAAQPPFGTATKITRDQTPSRRQIWSQAGSSGRDRAMASKQKSSNPVGAGSFIPVCCLRSGLEYHFEKCCKKLRSLASSSPAEARRQISPSVRQAKSHGAPCRSPGGLQAHAQVAEPGKGDQRQQRGAKLPSESSGRRGGRQRKQGKNCHSPDHSSDSQTDLQPKARNTSQKVKGSHSSKRHHRGRGSKRHRSTSTSPARHKHASGRKKSKSRGSLRHRSSSWSSSRSSSRSNSREHAPSKAKSPHTRQNNSRERDSPHYSDAERARRRSRSYSPIRKRRRDSPSFMEARRITSARKRPIPYYRPSPSSSSSASSYSRSSRSHSYASYSSYSRSRSRSRSKSRSRSRSRSGSRSPSQARSYYSHSSYESPGF